MIGPNRRAHPVGAELLDEEDADDDGDRQRHHVGVEERRGDCSPSIAPRIEMAGVMMPSP